MLKPEDRNAIEGLFAKLRQVQQNDGPRDAEAEALIREEISALPAAPYYLAQTVLVQEFALKGAEQKINELEAQLAQRETGGGGLFGGLFGGGDRQEAQQQRVPSPAPRGPWGARDGQAIEDRDGPIGGGRRGGGGGFLAGAAQTALGVTGGVLLGSALSGMFSNPAQASEEPAPQDDPAQEEPYAQDDTGADDGGDDNFDMGGDF